MPPPRSLHGGVHAAPTPAATQQQQHPSTQLSRSPLAGPRSPRAPVRRPQRARPIPQDAPATLLPRHPQAAPRRPHAAPTPPPRPWTPPLHTVPMQPPRSSNTTAPMQLHAAASRIPRTAARSCTPPSGLPRRAPCRGERRGAAPLSYHDNSIKTAPRGNCILLQVLSIGARCELLG